MSALIRRIRPFSLVWLAAMWCLLYGEVTVANIVAGVAVGIIIQLVFPLPALPLQMVHVNVREFLGLMWMFVTGLLSGAVSVSWLAIRPQDPPKSAILTVPMRVESDFAMVTGVSLYNLQPGGTVLDMDLAKKEWTVHLLDASSTSKIDQAFADIADLERRLIATFEASTDKAGR
ncbi:MAG: Na+/H+ antiporter subunit E [Corynebacterium glucuronolyticum]|nr:Na+/H+ antiporter subunit E [Corynebacterium glucuronolyticum]